MTRSSNDNDNDSPATTEHTPADEVEAENGVDGADEGDEGADDAPRVVDEAAWADANDDEEDDDDDVPLHLGAVAAEAEAAVAATPDVEVTLSADAEIPLALIDEDALWVVKRLRAKGFEAYLTGGCVRDLLLGRQPKDFDVATSAHPNQVRAVFRNCRLVGRRFRLAHVIFGNGKVIETATFRANPTDTLEDLPDDLLVARDNVFGNVEEDARRRDLTINGLFYDPVAGKVLDFVDGRTDLEAKLIRTIGDPEIRFQEDPVRILRAIKFAVRLGFAFEEKTWSAMQRHANGLLRCAPARLQEELLRLLASAHARQSFSLAKDAGVTAALWPELLAALESPPLPPATPQAEAPAQGTEGAPAEAAVVDASPRAAAEAPAVVDTADAGASPVVIELPQLAWPVLDTAAARAARFDACLGGLDDVRSRDADLTSALAFAMPLVPVWESLRDQPGAFDAWWAQTADAWVERLRLTRHDKERIPQLFATQFELSAERRRGHLARSLVGRPWFRESLLLLTVRLHAAGLPLDEIGAWKVVAASYGQPYQQPRFDRNRQRVAGRAGGEPRRQGGRGRDRDRDRGRGRSQGGGGGGGGGGRRRGR